MNTLKKNFKWIILVIILIIIASGISVYATSTYLATNVNYTRNNTTKSVSDALDELYSMKDNKYTEEQYLNYGSLKYLAGKNDNCIITEFTARYNNGNFYHYDLGFNPSMVVIDWGSDIYSMGKAGNSNLFSYSSNIAHISHKFNSGNNGFQIKFADSNLDGYKMTVYAIK